MTDPTTPCEVCGSPAAVAIRDLREAEPTKGGDGQLWATWESAGDHFFCTAHRRRPRRVYRPETSAWAIAEASLTEQWCQTYAKVMARCLEYNK